MGGQLSARRVLGECLTKCWLPTVVVFDTEPTRTQQSLVVTRRELFPALAEGFGDPFSSNHVEVV